MFKFTKFKKNKRLFVKTNRNIDSQKVLFNISQNLDASKLSLRLVLEKTENIETNYLNQYNLNIILTTINENPPETLDFILCLDKYMPNDFELIRQKINQSNYYKDNNKKAYLVIKKLNKKELNSLKSDFTDVNIVNYKSVFIKTCKNIFPNKQIEFLDKQISALNVNVGTKFVILNANAMALNPCENDFGFAMLHALAHYQTKYYINHKLLEVLRLSNFIKKHQNAVIIHCYYIDLIDELIEYIKPLAKDFDFFISLPNYTPKLFLDKFICNNINIKFYIVKENKGRDILPFIEQFNDIKEYNWVLKIHTKKSLHRNDGSKLRKDLWEKLINLDCLMFEKEYGMVAIKEYCLHFTNKLTYLALDLVNLEALKSFLGITTTSNYFIVGSMLWFRPNAIRQIAFLKDKVSFPYECGQNDGEIQHAIERIFYNLAEYNNFKIKLV